MNLRKEAAARFAQAGKSLLTAAGAPARVARQAGVEVKREAGSQMRGGKKGGSITKRVLKAIK